MRSSDENLYMEFDCDLYMDLMPLVKDGAASDTTRRALEAHLRECPNCRELYDTIPETEVTMDEGRVKRVMEKIRQRYQRSLLVLGVISVLVGVLLTMTRNMALSVAIFPLVGLGAYFLWRSRSLFIPLLVFSGSWLLLFLLALTRTTFLIRKRSTQIILLLPYLCILYHHCSSFQRSLRQE